MKLNDDDFLTPDRIDESLPTPLYHQIYLLLRERIVSGELETGAIVPGEQEMAKRLGVSRITIKRALNELAARGLVHRHRGRGTTVAGGAVIPLVASSFDTLVESLQRMGLQTDVELLDVGEELAGARVGERLGVAPDTKVQRAVRVRRLNGEPFSHLVNHIPLDIAHRFPERDLGSLSMLTLLQRAGAPAQEAEQWISAVAAPAAIAVLLDVSPGAPLLKIDRVMRGPQRRPVQFIEAHYRPDRYHYHFRTTRNGAMGGEWTSDG